MSVYYQLAGYSGILQTLYKGPFDSCPYFFAVCGRPCCHLFPRLSYSSSSSSPSISRSKFRKYRNTCRSGGALRLVVQQLLSHTAVSSSFRRRVQVYGIWAAIIGMGSLPSRRFHLLPSSATDLPKRLHDKAPPHRHDAPWNIPGNGYYVPIA